MKVTKLRKIWISIAAAMVIVSVPLIFVFKLPLGIDFTGGTLIELKTKDQQSQQSLEKSIGEFYDKKVIIQNTGDRQFIIRTSTLSNEDYKKLESNLRDKLGADILRHDLIGSSVGSATTKNAVYALIAAGIFIVIYLAWAFRKVPRSVSPWAFGTIALVTLIHDLGFTFAVFSIIGKFSGYEIDSNILVAALTILGFSVHDTIVVFDRIRENILKHPQRSLSDNADSSINQTIARSLNTSLAAILVLVSMLVLGGTSIRPFILILTLGIGIGTYSSIFVASPILVMYHERQNKNKS